MYDDQPTFQITDSAFKDYLFKKDEILQSDLWADFQRAIGRKVFAARLLGDNGRFLASALVIQKSIALGKSYLYSPRGPVFADSVRLNPTMDFLMQNIATFAHDQGAFFWRVEPDQDIFTNQSVFPVVQTDDIQPSKTIMLDLSLDQEALLSQMHSKTRYNIRLTQKKGVVVKEVGSDKFDDFWELARATGERDQFSLHPRDYYFKMLENFSKSKSIKMYLAYYQDKPIAGGIFSFYEKTARYLHGASSNEHRQIMAPYALQWAVICQAQNTGFKQYDFYGIDEQKWPGVTRFKRGFGGKEINYPGAFDIVFNPALYKTYISLRKINHDLKRIIHPRT